jgi:hypothetical protein
MADIKIMMKRGSQHMSAKMVHFDGDLSSFPPISSASHLLSSAPSTSHPCVIPTSTNLNALVLREENWRKLT